MSAVADPYNNNYIYSTLDDNGKQSQLDAMSQRSIYAKEMLEQMNFQRNKKPQDLTGQALNLLSLKHLKSALDSKCQNNQCKIEVFLKEYDMLKKQEI